MWSIVIGFSFTSPTIYQMTTEPHGCFCSLTLSRCISVQNSLISIKQTNQQSLTTRPQATALMSATTNFVSSRDSATLKIIIATVPTKRALISLAYCCHFPYLNNLFIFGCGSAFLMVIMQGHTIPRSKV